jgi:hypothetical protein
MTEKTLRFKILREGYMSQFLNPNELPLIMFKPLSDFNVVAKFKAETSASSSVSSRLPVILLQKSSHIPSFPMSIIYADISV